MGAVLHSIQTIRLLTAFDLQATPPQESARLKTLIILLGQTRSASLTGAGFQKHVIDAFSREGEVDVALCRCAGYEEPDDFFQSIAKYCWEFPEPAAWSDVYRATARELGGANPAEWERLKRVPGNWLGEIDEHGGKRKGSAARCLFLRYFALQQLRHRMLLGEYTHFILSRSDYRYIADHAPLSYLTPDRIWIPRGEEYGGITDRHTVFSPQHVNEVLDLLSPLLCSAPRLTALMGYGTVPWNLESFVKLMLIRYSAYASVRRFPGTMYLVRSDQATTSWSQGTYDAGLGFHVKYPAERDCAEANAAMLEAQGYSRESVCRQTLPERFDTFIHSATPVSFSLARWPRKRWQRFRRERLSWI